MASVNAPRRLCALLGFFFVLLPPGELRGSLPFPDAGFGHCTEERCYGLLKRLKDLVGALEGCKLLGGQLFEFEPAALELLPGNLTLRLGRDYWLPVTAEMAAALPKCSSVARPGPAREPTTASSCRDTTSGFLCQFANEKACPGLPAVEGARVTYHSHMGFQVLGTQGFPSGTIALTGKVGAQHPEAKQLCSGDTWTRAPWPCDVMGGGCDVGCDKGSGACTCPPGRLLAANHFSCAADPCAGCPRGCERLANGSRACACADGYRWTDAGCVDVDECESETRGGPRLCAGTDEECENTPGGFQCACRDGFQRYEGVCLDARVCVKCEHRCERSGRVFACVCSARYRVSLKDPHRCEMYCKESPCPAICVRSLDKPPQCYCPDGFINHSSNNGKTNICFKFDEREKLPGTDECTCPKGCEQGEDDKCFKKTDGSKADGSEKKDEGDEGSASGEPPLHPSLRPSLKPEATGAQAEAVPYYVKAGSVLGIAVFAVLAGVLLSFLVHGAVRRCGTFRLDSFKHSNMDNIFYLQQVTTETYKRLSLDKHFKNDPPQVP